jgi:hypothetical protein
MKIEDILSIYHEIHGTHTQTSNKQFHKRLKAMRDSVQWETTEVEIQYGNGVFKVKRYPDTYWQLHWYASRKEIIHMLRDA